MLLPAANDFMGRAVKRSLTDYIDSGDTSHVVAVWEPRGAARSLFGEPDEVLITGAVHEWADLRRPAQPAAARERLTSYFYACHAVPGVIGLDTLPFVDESGRPYRLAGYLDALRAMAAPYDRQAKLAITHKQYTWAGVLSDRHLDPEIFRIQKQMNHVEGGVEDLFTFASAREFIDFLLDLTTPPDAVTSVAQRLENVTALLRAKPRKLAEHDFCLAAAEDLDEVSSCHDGLLAAGAEVEARTADSARLASSFRATIDEAKARRESLAEQREAVAQELTRANNDKSTANDLAYLYRRAAARQRVQDAEAALEAAEEHVLSSAAQVTAWEIAQRLGALVSLREELAQARLEAATEEKEIAPLRAERDRHAVRLRQRLLTLAQHAEGAASEARAASETASADVERYDRLADEAAAEIETATSDAVQADTKLSTMAERLRTGVERGHLPSENTDLIAHREALTVELRTCDHRLRELAARWEHRRNRRSEIADRNQKLNEERGAAARERDDAAARHSALTARLGELTASPRLRELAEATPEDPLDPWGEGPALLRRLQDGVIAADNERVRRRAELHADERTIEAQERDAVLPTTLDAERVERLLIGSGIAAEAGWAYLRGVLPADRLLAAIDEPGIVQIGCGVIVPTGSMQDAIRLLESQSTVTTSLVGVFTTSDVEMLLRIHDEGGAGVRPGWLGLEPGLVDPDLAEAAVRRLKERVRSHLLREKELEARRAADDELRRELEDFLDECPAGHLELLSREIVRLDEALEEIRREQEANRSELRGLDDADDLDGSERDSLNSERTRIDKALSWLDEMVPVLAQRGEWQARKEDAEARKRAASERQTRHAAASRRADRIAHEQARRAEDEDERARAHRSEAAALSVTALDQAVEDDPSVPLDVLRDGWERAERAVENRASQSVFADRVQRLTADVEDAAGELARLDPDDLERARQLLASPEGQEPARRAAARQAAHTAANAAVENRGRAKSDLKVRQRELEDIERRHRQPPRRALPTVPLDADHAAALAAEQDVLAQQAQERGSRAEGVIREIETEDRHYRERAEYFATFLDDLPTLPDVAEPAFTGDREAGRVAARDAKERLAAAVQRRTEGERRLTVAVDALRQTATRHPAVTGPVKDRVANDPVTALGPHASDLAARLRLRAQTLTDELDAIAKDQQIISEALADLVKQSFEMLGKAERASLMPTAHGAWAGKKVLRISFDRPHDGDLSTYADRIIDQLIVKGLRPDGMSLLKTTLHEAAGPRGFTVKVVKPTTDRVSTTEDISRLAKWSGGEKLTVCVALYCTLAALRATGTGRRGRSGGVLLLDNPIGRASSAPLVRLQRDVAAAHGVQLIYTTGVKDPAAVIQFPNIIRLDNRAGRTRNRRFIVHEENRGDEQDEPPGGTVTGIRVAHTDHGRDPAEEPT
ncbi:hypothetical protein Acsp03_24750 [Actinomadura sp. NBRC 104412]|nr:hypothetical protein Acsp03_24750 [Actinomadura sp. NBRC 104412]